MPRFVRQLVSILNNPATDQSIIRWAKGGDGFLVDSKRFEKSILMRQLCNKATNFAAFRKQLNIRGLYQVGKDSNSLKLFRSRQEPKFRRGIQDLSKFERVSKAANNISMSLHESRGVDSNTTQGDSSNHARMSAAQKHEYANLMNQQKGHDGYEDDALMNEDGRKSDADEPMLYDDVTVREALSKCVDESRKLSDNIQYLTSQNQSLHAMVRNYRTILDQVFDAEYCGAVSSSNADLVVNKTGSSLKDVQAHLARLYREYLSLTAEPLDVSLGGLSGALTSNEKESAATISALNTTVGSSLDAGYQRNYATTATTRTSVARKRARSGTRSSTRQESDPSFTLTGPSGDAVYEQSPAMDLRDIVKTNESNDVASFQLEEMNRTHRSVSGAINESLVNHVGLEAIITELRSGVTSLEPLRKNVVIDEMNTEGAYAFDDNQCNDYLNSTETIHVPDRLMQNFLTTFEETIGNFKCSSYVDEFSIDDDDETASMISAETDREGSFMSDEYNDVKQHPENKQYISRLMNTTNNTTVSVPAAYVQLFHKFVDSSPYVLSFLMNILYLIDHQLLHPSLCTEFMSQIRKSVETQVTRLGLMSAQARNVFRVRLFLEAYKRMTRTRPEYAVLTIKHFIVLHDNEMAICRDPKHKPCLAFILSYRSLLIQHGIPDEELGTMSELAKSQEGKDCLAWLDTQEQMTSSRVDAPNDSWAANITVK
jgi:hypothetical protein